MDKRFQTVAVLATSLFVATNCPVIAQQINHVDLVQRRARIASAGVVRGAAIFDRKSKRAGQVEAVDGQYVVVSASGYRLRMPLSSFDQREGRWTTMLDMDQLAGVLAKEAALHPSK